MKKITELVLLALLWLGSVIGLSSYMYYLRAPSVIAVRPELKDVGFSTALFSGRFFPWLWHHHPEFGLVLVMVVCSLWVLALIPRYITDS